MEVKLSNNETVVLKDKLTYGEVQNLRKTLALPLGYFTKDGNVTSPEHTEKALDTSVEAQNKVAGMLIEEIKANGQTKPYSHDWLMGLDFEDGELLADKIAEVTEPYLKKKKDSQKQG